jgi:hypothetical protein
MSSKEMAVSLHIQLNSRLREKEGKMKHRILTFLSLSVFILFIGSTLSLAQYFGYYVLDGFGGVHRGGGAPAITPGTPYFGWDIAKAIEYVPVGYSDKTYGHGLMVLDGYGGVHLGGALKGVTPAIPTTPYFGWNIARDIASISVPPRAGGTYSTGGGTITSNTFVVISSIEIVLPDDGFVFISGGFTAYNTSQMYQSRVWLGFGVDNSSSPYGGVLAGSNLPPMSLGSYLVAQVEKSLMVFVSSAGRHSFYLLARKDETAYGIVLYQHPTLSAIYVDQAGDGFSSLSANLQPKLLP